MHITYLSIYFFYRWKHSGFKELYSDRRSRSISRRSSSSFSSSCSRTSIRRSPSHKRRKPLSRSPDLRRSRRSLSLRRGSPLNRRRSPYRTRKSPLTLHSRRRRRSTSESPTANGSRIRRSRSLSRRRRSPLLGRNRRLGITSPPPKRRASKKHGLKRIRTSSAEEVYFFNFIRKIIFMAINYIYNKLWILINILGTFIKCKFMFRFSLFSM